VGDEAADPYLDEDYLILSTIHSAKGQEWDVVYVLNVVDGCIPSDMATGTPEEVEEERRLLYVAMTRARDHLYLLHPHRFYTRRRPNGDNHVHAPRTRFIPDTLPPLLLPDDDDGRGRDAENTLYTHSMPKPPPLTRTMHGRFRSPSIDPNSIRASACLAVYCQRFRSRLS